MSNVVVHNMPDFQILLAWQWRLFDDARQCHPRSSKLSNHAYGLLTWKRKSSVLTNRAPKAQETSLSLLKSTSAGHREHLDSDEKPLTKGHAFHPPDGWWGRALCL